MLPRERPIETESFQLRYDGGTARFTPALDPKTGKPITLPVGVPLQSAKSQLFLAEVQSGNGGLAKKCISREVMQDPAMPGQPLLIDGKTQYTYRELYVHPVTKNIFGFPVTPGSQTITRVVTPEGSTMPVDLYLTKGFRFATLDELLAQAEKARTNFENYSKKMALRHDEGAQAANLADKIVMAASLVNGRNDPEKDALRAEIEALKKQVANGKK